MIETVSWDAGKVRLLDQRALPEEERYLAIGELPELIEAIRSLAVRGAPALGVTGALGLAMAAHASKESDPAALLAELKEAAGALDAARPTAVNLRAGLERVMRKLESYAAVGASSAELRTQCLAEAQLILTEDLDLSARMAQAGAALLPDRGTVLTHCNTGGLATAGGGTALGVVLQAARLGKEIFVHVDETRPLLQGARLTAWELEKAKIPYVVQCDGAAAWALSTRKVDAVLVGADRIARNGDTANKVGTLAVALAATEFKVPFYVVAPRTTFDLTIESGAEIPIEERDPNEVLEWSRRRTAPAGARGWNPAFDVTPARFITAWITERGVEHPPFA
jgi:methylthioribose-1-phosphate isomerase